MCCAGRGTTRSHRPLVESVIGLGRCGSPLDARSSQDPDDIRVRLGGFEGGLDVTITGPVWTWSRSIGYVIEDSLPRCPEAISHDPDSVPAGEAVGPLASDEA